MEGKGLFRFKHITLYEDLIIHFGEKAKTFQKGMRNLTENFLATNYSIFTQQ